MGAYGVVGDPQGMHALADDLSHRARRLREIRADVRKRWRDVDFAGPFATTVNDALARQLRRFEVAADTLEATATRLRSSANAVTQQIALARARYEQAERERLDRLRQAQEEGRG